MKKRAKTRWIGAAGLVLLCGTKGALAGRMESIDYASFTTPLYSVEGDAFVRHNGDRFNNRPLYNNHINGAVLAGDKPYVTAGANKMMVGNLMVALERGGKATWLFMADDVTSKYRPGRMEWTVKDAAWGGTVVVMEVVPVAEGPGYAARVHVENAQAGDRLIWGSGGAGGVRESVLQHWDMTIPGGASLLHRGFVPADCEKASIAVSDQSWTTGGNGADGAVVAIGRCSGAGKIVVADASGWKDAVALAGSTAKAQPMAASAIPLDGVSEIFWSFRAAGDAGSATTPADDFAAGMTRAEKVGHQVVVDTPDKDLNAAVGASCAVTDGVFRNQMYTHAGMRWGVPLIGWRTIFGGTVYGWHDNVKAEANLCIAKQITESDKTEAKADPTKGLSSQDPGSRMFGKGRINVYHTYHYDMQSQFFDQIQHAWRFTGDNDLQRLLRPSLDLHCEYIKDCFDPDGDGIYESYANSWPTDDQWYNGGGTSEETAYAYRAEMTAILLARNANDDAGVKLHQANVEHIRKGFFDLLWSKEHGHPGAYREQGGLNRLHESAWLYGVFCPIDAGLLDKEQSVQALRYTETELERVNLPYGGEQCWPSNWVPSIWSVREMWPGDNYQLALAYFQTGLPEQGYSLLHGTFPQQMFYGTVPADLGHPAGATDFNDCASMFARTVVEGLFGYAPDYPNDVVRIAPQFPKSWDHASIKTPDVTIAFQRNAGAGIGGDGICNLHCNITLAKPGNIELSLPIATSGLKSVTVNGEGVKAELVPGFGHSLVRLSIPSTAQADVEIQGAGTVVEHPARGRSMTTGEAYSVSEAIVAFHDPQAVLKDAHLEQGTLKGTASGNAGEHQLFELVQLPGGAQYWQIENLHITDAEADKAAADGVVGTVPAGATWAPVDMKASFNADLRKIFEQKYLSPRPNTCSLRLATDGYSTWQMILDKKNKTPDIDFSLAAGMLKDAGGGAKELWTIGKIPFAWTGAASNVAFTSRWDNYPHSVTVPVNQQGDAAYFLLAGSTNPMEVRIANAEIRMEYADGSTDKIELVPPFNFWSLCAFGGIDYDYPRDGFSLPRVPPASVELGKNCRAIVLNHRLRPGKTLTSVTLETLSQQVVIGLMGVTVMNPKAERTP